MPHTCNSMILQAVTEQLHLMLLIEPGTLKSEGLSPRIWVCGPHSPIVSAISLTVNAAEIPIHSIITIEYLLYNSNFLNSSKTNLLWKLKFKKQTHTPVTFTPNKFTTFNPNKSFKKIYLKFTTLFTRSNISTVLINWCLQLVSGIKVKSQVVMFCIHQKKVVMFCRLPFRFCQLLKSFQRA